MVKESFNSLKDFQDNIRPYRYIKSNEGTIYFKDEFVYKIFDFSNFNEYFANITNIKRLSKLDENLFSIPCSLIFIDGDFVGFKMHNMGISLIDKLLNENLSFEDKKQIGYGLKDIAEHLKRKRMVHFDINIKNILCLNGNVSLTDINGMMSLSRAKSFKNEYIRMLELYQYWYSRYGVAYLDYLEVNFCTHILFNCSKECLTELFTKKSNRPFSNLMDELLDVDNTSFEDDVFDYLGCAFNEKKMTLDPNTYLIDYLK